MLLFYLFFLHIYFPSMEQRSLRAIRNLAGKLGARMNQVLLCSRCSEVPDIEEVNSSCFLCLRASHGYLLRSHLTR